MGNPRSFTTNYVAVKSELEAFVKAKAGRSTTKRKAAKERAAIMPNGLPPSARKKAQEQGRGN